MVHATGFGRHQGVLQSPRPQTSSKGSPPARDALEGGDGGGRGGLKGGGGVAGTPLLLGSPYSPCRRRVLGSRGGLPPPSPYGVRPFLYTPAPRIPLHTSVAHRPFHKAHANKLRSNVPKHGPVQRVFGAPETPVRMYKGVQTRALGAPAAARPEPCAACTAFHGRRSRSPAVAGTEGARKGAGNRVFGLCRKKALGTTGHTGEGPFVVMPRPRATGMRGNRRSHPKRGVMGPQRRPIDGGTARATLGGGVHPPVPSPTWPRVSGGGSEFQPRTSAPATDARGRCIRNSVGTGCVPCLTR